MKAGDHLRVLKDGVWDHAIDVGDRTVIRWVPRLGVLRSGHGEFVSGAERGEVVVHRERTFKAREVVARAFSRFAESAYGAMFQSPEQFAVWCKNGQLPAAPLEAPVKARAARKAAPAKAVVKKAVAKVAPRKAAAKAAPKKAAVKRKPAAKARPKKKLARKGASKKAAPRKAAARRPARRPARRR